LGCKLAYLVANRLIAEGEKVKALCLLDGAAPDQNLYEDDTIPTEDMLRNFLIQKVSATTGGLLEDQAGFEDGELDRRVQALSAVMPLVMFQTGPENSPRDIPTLLITASRDDGLSGIAVETFGADLGWNRFVKNPEIKQLNSTHDRLLTQPDLQEVVKLWKHFSANLQE
jgi:thioesterase domain-containing protein